MSKLGTITQVYRSCWDIPDVKDRYPVELGGKMYVCAAERKFRPAPSIWENPRSFFVREKPAHIIRIGSNGNRLESPVGIVR